MTIWLRARNPAGLPVPWVAIRRQLAARWGIPPWAVDEAPWDEVLIELRLSAIEARVARERA